jgi:hypothetical protein
MKSSWAINQMKIGAVLTIPETVSAHGSIKHSRDCLHHQGLM